MLGHHLIKAWSATQASIALSFGEAEYYGVVRGTGIALGIRALYSDIGLSVWTDSTAALGIGGRQGLGKLRHLESHSLLVGAAAPAPKGVQTAEGRRRGEARRRIH